MSKAKILIVEDEPLIADDIEAILTKAGYEVVAIVDEAIDALDAVQKHQPDMALLDINIEGNSDGIDLAGKLDIPFVFLTSYYDQKTLDRAKKTNPSGYIVKPFNESDLIVNVEMALAKKQQANKQTLPPEKLFVKNGSEIISVMSDEIIYVEAFDNYANLFTEQSKYIISHTLKSIEEKLSPLGFLRVHRSFLINFAHVDSVSEGYVFLKGHKVLLGKSYRKDFLESLQML